MLNRKRLFSCFSFGEFGFFVLASDFERKVNRHNLKYCDDKRVQADCDNRAKQNDEEIGKIIFQDSSQKIRQQYTRRCKSRHKQISQFVVKFYAAFFEREKV